MPVPPLPISRKPVPGHSPIATSENLRVFIYDDDLEFADEMASGLTASGFIAKTLAGAREPMQALKAFRPDVLLLDIFMPPPNGFEIIELIHDDTALRTVPLILMSGTDTGLLDVATQLCIGRKLHVAATCQKPLRLNEIIRVCRAAAAAHPVKFTGLTRDLAR